jgi:Skp family chaperone for outer membrane proteins
MRVGGLFVAVALMMTALPAAAQDVQPVPTPSAVIVVDSERLFIESAYGKKLRADIDAQAAAVNVENERIVADLTTEERSLTVRRPTMTPEAFREEAAAFDTKVQEIRRARDAKEAELQQARSDARVTFYEQARPIVGQLMIERGAVAVLDSRSVFVVVRSVDVTAEAIAKIDAALMPTATDGNGGAATGNP